MEAVAVENLETPEIAIENHGRFKGAEWYTPGTQVIVGGVGGIGSWLTLMLYRAGFKAFVYDFDLLETHNMSGQLLYLNDVGRTKGYSMSRVIKNLTGDDLHYFDTPYDSSSPTCQYVFAAFDNIAARKLMFEKWYETYANSTNAIFIDGRLLAEQMQIFCVTPDKADLYREHLFDDSEVEEANCTFKQTSHSAAMIASHMVGFFTNFVSNNKSGMNARDVPFLWSYFIPVNMTLQEES